jgi:putative endonuclease
MVDESWFVYILKCRDGSLYTGITTDPVRRLYEHNRGKGAKYTRSRAPCELLKSWEVVGKSRALKIESKIKKMNRKMKLSLIECEFVDHLL